MRNFWIRRAKKISQAEQKPVCNCGQEHLKDPVAALAKALECLENPHWGRHLVSQFVVANLCRRSGFQHRWREEFAKDVGWALFGKVLAFPGPLGCCGFARKVLRPECPWEVWAPWGALFIFLIKKEPFALMEQVPH